MDRWPVINPGYMASRFSYWWINMINGLGKHTLIIFSKSRRARAHPPLHHLKSMLLEHRMGWSCWPRSYPSIATSVGKNGWFRMNNQIPPEVSIHSVHSNLHRITWICLKIGSILSFIYSYIYILQPHFITIISSYSGRYTVGCSWEIHGYPIVSH